MLARESDRLVEKGGLRVWREEKDARFVEHDRVRDEVISVSGVQLLMEVE